MVQARALGESDYSSIVPIRNPHGVMESEENGMTFRGMREK